VTTGGLASYDADRTDIFRRTASYVDRALRGEKPGDLPFQQPTKCQLTINLKSAKAFGHDVPDKLLVAADEVIEITVFDSPGWVKSTHYRVAAFLSASPQ
jgi:putative ABC transport system substrate-binding protein